MNNLKELEVWFVTGSQHLYGDEILKKVAEHSEEIAKSLDADQLTPVRVSSSRLLNLPKKFFLFARKPIILETASASLPGCIPFPLPRCGSAD